jgi:hypothetical protein
MARQLHGVSSLLCALVFASTIGAGLPKPQPEVPVYGAVDGTTITGSTTLANWECVQASKCPAAFLLTPSGNFVGCSSDALGCFGSCYTCSGTPGVINICAAKPVQNCNVQLGPLSSCGTIRQHPSGCTGLRPSGYPSTPNNCYCITSYGTVATPYACTVAPCLY